MSSWSLGQTPDIVNRALWIDGAGGQENQRARDSGRSAPMWQHRGTRHGWVVDGSSYFTAVKKTQVLELHLGITHPVSKITSCVTLGNDLNFWELQSPNLLSPIHGKNCMKLKDLNKKKYIVRSVW